MLSGLLHIQEFAPWNSELHRRTGGGRGGAYGIQVTHIGCAEFPGGQGTNVTGAQLYENSDQRDAHPFRPVHLTSLWGRAARDR